MSFFKKKNIKEVKAFASGTVISLNEVHDPMFAEGLMGVGIAIESVDGKFYSPVDGTITMLFPTYHALGIQMADGEELLLHIGIDTVNLKGEGFQAYVESGQKVKTGDLLLRADLPFIKEKGCYTEAILCMTEPKELHITLTQKETVDVKKDVLMTIYK